MAIVTGDPTAVHVTPSAERNAAKESPVRVSRTQCGAVTPVLPFTPDPAGPRVSGVKENLIRLGQASEEQLRTEARDYLEGVAGRLHQRGLAARTRVVVHEQPAAAILDAARDQAADLIALTTHGRGGLARLILGSVADAVVQGAATPVLVSRPVGP